MPNVQRIGGDDGSNVLSGTAGNDLIYGFDPNGPQSDVTSIAATRVATGLSQPLFATAPKDDVNRLYIVEKTGLIKVLDLASGQVDATPFLDVRAQISADGEGGLLGLAFDPDFLVNGRFYVNLTNTSGDTEVRSYRAAAGGGVADLASASPIIAIDQPAGLANHKAGWLGFGPDGFLYASLGDGGGGGDPFNNGQNAESLLGKMLRLDVGSDGFPTDPTRNYAIPADNPFVGMAGADEIWALGLRNPWRPSFDRATGDLFIADVGQERWEEINHGTAGANYGWDSIEGPEVYSSTALGPGTLTAPISFYGRSVGQSFTGGYSYRGESDGLQGQYVYGDFASGRVFTLRFDGTRWTSTERTGQIQPDVGSVALPSSFGEDGSGNLYVVTFGGDVFRLTPTGPSADQGGRLEVGAGDDYLFGGAGNDLLVGGTGQDTLNGGAGTDTASYASSTRAMVIDLGARLADDGDTFISIENALGSAFGDTFVSSVGANVFTGGGGRDTYRGTAANLDGDTIADFTSSSVINVTDAVGSLSNLTLVGNVLSFSLGGEPGMTSTVNLQGNFADPSLQQRAASTGVDIYFATLSNRPLFGTVATDASGPVGQVYELYSGLLGRAPDAGGFQYRIDTLGKGGSLASLAGTFLSSPEYLSAHGSVLAESNAEFVSEMYQAVLGRPGESGGITFWVDQLAQGVSRPDVAVRFVLSPENLAQDAAAFAAGVFAPDSSAGDVARLYYGTLDRAPDAAGLAFHTAALRAGSQELDIARNMLASPEYAARFGTPDAATLVDNLYDGALRRDPTAAELASGQAALASGQSRAAFAVAISDSPEANAFHLPDIEAGWHVV